MSVKKSAFRHGEHRTKLGWVLLCPVLGALLSAPLLLQPQTRNAGQTQASPIQAQKKEAVKPLEARREMLTAQSLDGALLPYRILLPADYEKSQRRYPVLYLLHGLTGNENDWWERTHLAQYAERFRLIIVTPGVGDSWYANGASNPKARYEDVIINDLIPHIDKSYRTLAKREGRAIAGLSMGGLGALKFGLRYPQLFNFAASFSGAFEVPITARLGQSPSAKMLRDLRAVFGAEKSQTRRENNLFLLLDQPLPKGTSWPYFYVTTGQSDVLPQVSQSNPRLAAALKEHQARYEYYERPGGHDWRFWDSEVQIMLGRLCVMMPSVCS